MGTRSCGSLKWVAATILLSVVVGQASAIGPGPLLRCHSVQPGEPFFGYVPTAWRPWPVVPAPAFTPAPVPVMPPPDAASVAPSQALPRATVPAAAPAEGSSSGGWARHTVDVQTDPAPPH
jgi:hypothetical protein